MKEAKIQWHSAFVSAMGLDFEENRGDLIFEKEYNLNTKPLEIHHPGSKASRAVPLF